MPQATPTHRPPTSVKNFRVAFLILGLLMIAAQTVNFIITLLPGSQDAVVQLDDGSTVTVAALSDTYLTLVIIYAAIYGLTWFWVYRHKNWARWIAVVLTLIAAVFGVQGLFQAIAAGGADLIGLTLNLALVIAAGWVLALAFQPELHDWFKHATPGI